MRREEGTGEISLFFKDTSSYGTSVNNTPCGKHEDTKIKNGSKITMGDITLTAKRIPLVFMFHNKKEVASADEKAWIEKIGVPNIIGGKMEYKDVSKATHLIADTLNSKKITKKLLTALLRCIPIINSKWVISLANNLGHGLPDVKKPEYAPSIESNDSFSDYVGLTQKSLHVNYERKSLFENVNIVFFEQKQYDMFHEIMSYGGGNPVMWERDVFFPAVIPGCTTIAMKPTDEEEQKLRITIFRKRNYVIIDDEMLVKSIVFVRPIQSIVDEINKSETAIINEMKRSSTIHNNHNVNREVKEEEDLRNGGYGDGGDDGEKKDENADEIEENEKESAQHQEKQKEIELQSPPAKFPRLYEGAGTSAPPPLPKNSIPVIPLQEDNIRGSVKIQYAYLVRNKNNNNSKTPLYTTKTFRKSGTGNHSMAEIDTSNVQRRKPIKFVRCIVGKKSF